MESKGLEALKKYRNQQTGVNVYADDYLDIIEKELKALEIINNKKVDVKYLYYRAEFNVEKYNDNYIEGLTQEENDLLKEVLLWK